MRRIRKLTTYIRRLRSTDRPMGGIITAMRVGVFKQTGGYGLVQRGFPNLVMEAARTREDLVRTMLGALRRAKERHKKNRRPSGRDIRSWANDLGRYARGVPEKEARAAPERTTP